MRYKIPTTRTRSWPLREVHWSSKLQKGRSQPLTVRSRLCEAWHCLSVCKADELQSACSVGVLFVWSFTLYTESHRHTSVDPAWHSFYNVIGRHSPGWDQTSHPFARGMMAHTLWVLHCLSCGQIHWLLCIWCPPQKAKAPLTRMGHHNVRPLQDLSLTAVAMVENQNKGGGRHPLPFHRNYAANGIDLLAVIQSVLGSIVAVATLKRVSNPGKSAARGCTFVLRLAAGVSIHSSSMGLSDS